MTEESRKKLIAAGRQDLIDVFDLNKTGYVGCDKNGTLVDRRKFPDAVPVKENYLFGVVKPIPLDNEPHPEYFQ